MKANTLTRGELQNLMRRKPKRGEDDERPLCWRCDKHLATDVHHKNGIHHDNSPENLISWCKRCHNQHHGISDDLTVLGLLVRQFYGIQRQRIAMGSRVSAYEKLGYDVLITKGIMYGLEMLEQETKKLVEQVVEKEPIYHAYLRCIKGVGPLIAATLITRIGDPSRFATISALWAYCGLHVIDGKAPKRKRER